LIHVCLWKLFLGFRFCLIYRTLNPNFDFGEIKKNSKLRILGFLKTQIQRCPRLPPRATTSYSTSDIFSPSANAPPFLVFCRSMEVHSTSTMILQKRRSPMVDDGVVGEGIATTRFVVVPAAVHDLQWLPTMARNLCRCGLLIPYGGRRRCEADLVRGGGAALQRRLATSCLWSQRGCCSGWRKVFLDGFSLSLSNRAMVACHGS